jgi:hypothetical protein
MFDKLLSGMISPEQKEEAVSIALNDTIDDIIEEFSASGEIPQCGYGDFVIMIRPIAPEDPSDDTKKKFKCYILKGTPELIKAVPGALHREIEVREIVE